MRRRLLILFAVVATGVVVAFLALPWWLDTAAGWAGERQGVAFRRYERLGYARFALHDIEVKRPGVRVTASRVEASTPLLWAWRHWRGQPDEIRVERWAVDVEKRTAPAPARTDTGWMPLRAKIQGIAAQLDRWLRRGEAGPGVVRWAGGELKFGSATWRGRELTVNGFNFRALTVDAVARFAASADRIDIVLRQPGDGAVLTLTNEGTAVRGDIAWAGQRAPLTARFAPSGWLPAEAAVNAEDWAVPGERLRLKDTFARVRGRARLDWDGETFGADAQAQGEPVEGKKVPPLRVQIAGRGTPAQFTVRAFDASIPGVEARLTEPVTIDRTGKVRDGAGARFTWRADLGQQPWFEAHGIVEGEASLGSPLAESPVVDFRMRAADLVARGVALSAIEAAGQFHWPQIELAQAVLTGGEGERIEARGAWDFRRQELRGVSVDGTLRRESLARWLPAQPAFESITVHAEAAGRLAGIEHRGRAEATALKVAGLNPIAAAVDWRGRGAGAENFTLVATAGATRLSVGGSGDRASLRLEKLTLERDGAVLLTLAEPSSVRWQPGLTVEPLRLAGGESRIAAAVTWGESGRMEASARNIPSAWLADLVALKGPAWTIDLLAFTGNWSRAPMTYALTIGATVELGEGRNAAVMASSRGDKDGLHIEALRATEGNETVLNAVGRLPLTLQPGRAKLLQLDEAGPLVLDATAAPHSAFWPMLASATGIELKDPQAELHLKGTWARPEGSIELNAGRVAIDPQRLKREIPALEALRVELDADRGGVTLTRFSVQVQGQAVRVRGRVPVADGGWSQVLKEPRTVLERDADLHLEVPDADVAVFTKFLPAVLAPKGRFSVDLKYQGGSLSGVARLRDAASRPLGPLGVLQEVNAEVEMAGRTVTLRSVAAKAGGQPVTLTGSVEVPSGAAPRYDLALRGGNLPFVRQTGLLLRGDLDLKLQSPREGPPRISGQLRLRDSLFLQDVRAFMPRPGGGPARRPPYFSVDTPPLNTWVLAIEVVGDEFMRLRTPVFQGVASAHVRLGGTLGEPRALGDITINSGSVRMPFAAFEVKQGSVRLTEADPDQPDIYLRATARRFGYDLTMEIEGAASRPNVEFTSSPALDSEQVLLMVMTGAVPSNEITYSGTRRVAHIGAYLGQSLLGSLGADTGNADRLTIASGEKISRQGEETYDIEYKLSDRWTATGEYNEYDEYNVGLKWRVLPRKTKKEKREEPVEPAGQGR